MKKILTVITSALLCMTMLVLAPTQVIASAAENDEEKYISEVKVGMGEDSETASKALLDEGYTILKDDNGNYADLNKDAGTSSIAKKGPNQKIVYLGYKTTADANDAITDLAVMNMEGGFRYEEYEKMMDEHMKTQIKPFTDRFIATLREYRENLQKPQDSANFKRANYYKTLLNKLTDDDTGGKPLGDLLANPTKYEMGDEAYNKLSDAEKKNHCDILTLLMQGNGQAVQLMETELTKSSDSSGSTWLDRFKATSLDKLTNAAKEKNPNMTPSEINQELDKQYYDDAKRILDKWGAFNEILFNYDNAIDKAKEAVDENNNSKEREAVRYDKNSSKEYFSKVTNNLYDDEKTMIKGSNAAEDIIVHDSLDAITYGDGTMLEFFERDKNEFDDANNIRKLYPIVDSLTGGQLAGLDFLSIKDMVIMAVTDEKGYDSVNVQNLEPASIYQDVNREIYEKGGVALTDAAMRANATAQEKTKDFELSTLSIVLWSCTSAAGIAAIGTGIKAALVSKAASNEAAAVVQSYNEASKRFDVVKAHLDYLSDQSDGKRFILEKLIADGYDDKIPSEKMFLEMADQDLIDANNEWKDYLHSDEYVEARNNFKESEENLLALEESAGKSNICKYLSAGFSVLTAVLAGISIYTTIKEYVDYYKVTFAPIPKYIVDRQDIMGKNAKGQPIMIQNQTAYYKAVLCNRTAGNSDVEKENYRILQDRNDLNGDVGKQWLSLYSVKYVNGLPILADSLKLKMGKGNAPEGYTTGIHRFGEKTVFNLTSAPNYCYNDPYDGTYVYFKNDTATVKDLTATGSLFSGGSIALGALIGLIVGSTITLFIVNNSRKKKKQKKHNR